MTNWTEEGLTKLNMEQLNALYKQAIEDNDPLTIQAIDDEVKSREDAGLYGDSSEKEKKTMNKQQCECFSWCRANIGGPYTQLKGKDIPFVITNHHPHCPHYNDSLIDVWKVQYENQFYYTDKPPCQEEMESGETVTQEKMHKEVFEQLPEFEGF